MKAPVETGDSLTRTITGITATSYTVTGLQANSELTYYVKAYDSDGNASKDSNVVTVQLADNYTLGDVNDDGVVDVSDITILINKILGLNPVPFNGQAADLDSNGTYDVSDITQLINKILEN